MRENASLQGSWVCLTGFLTPCGAQVGRSQEEIISEQRAQVLGLWSLGLFAPLEGNNHWPQPHAQPLASREGAGEEEEIDGEAVRRVSPSPGPTTSLLLPEEGSGPGPQSGQ